MGVWKSVVKEVVPTGTYMNMTISFDYSCTMSDNNKKHVLYNLTLGSNPEDFIEDRDTRGVELLDPQYKYYFERQEDESKPLDRCDIKVTVRSNSTSLVQVTVPYKITE